MKCRDAGYDVEEMDATWRMLESAERSEPSSFDKIFASHPPARERFAKYRGRDSAAPANLCWSRKVDTPEFDQIKALLGGGRVNPSGSRRRPDISENEEIYNSPATKRKRSRDLKTPRPRAARMNRDHRFWVAKTNRIACRLLMKPDPR